MYVTSETWSTSKGKEFASTKKEKLKLLIRYQKSLERQVSKQELTKMLEMAENLLGHLEHWQTVQTLIRSRRMIRVCTVCLSYRNLRVKGNSLKFPFRTIFPTYNQRQSITSAISSLIQNYRASSNKTIRFCECRCLADSVRNIRKRTFWHVRSANFQINLRIRAVWSES